MASKKSDSGHESKPGKIFVGGISKETTLETFVSYFGKYGEIADSVIMKDRKTGRARGFGFITYADPAVVDTVISQTHLIDNKQVEIKRTIPKGASESKDFKTKKIFVGGLPVAVLDDEFKDFFSKYGKVVQHEIIRESKTSRSRGFGFIVFDSEQVVDNILADGNKIDMSGTQVEIKRAEPKKPSNSGPAPAFHSDPRSEPKKSSNPGPVPAFYSDPSRNHAYCGIDNFGGLESSHDRFGSGGFGSALPPYRSSFGGNDLSSRLGGGDYGRFGPGSGDRDFSGRYGDLGSGGFGGYWGEPSLGYSSRYASSYGAGLGGGYGGAPEVGSYGRGEGGYGRYGESGPVGGYESGLSSGYGRATGLYGSRGGYSGGGGSRYHPYAM